MLCTFYTAVHVLVVTYTEHIMGVADTEYRGKWQTVLPARESNFKVYTLTIVAQIV